MFSLHSSLTWCCCWIKIFSVCLKASIIIILVGEEWGGSQVMERGEHICRVYKFFVLELVKYFSTSL